MSKRQELVAVAWLDAQADAGWQDVPTSSPPPMIWSVGFVVHRPTKGEPWWTLFGDASPADALAGGNRLITIPKVCVSQAVDLGYVTEDGWLWKVS